MTEPTLGSSMAGEILPRLKKNFPGVSEQTASMMVVDIAKEVARIICLSAPSSSPSFCTEELARLRRAWRFESEAEEESPKKDPDAAAEVDVLSWLSQMAARLEKEIVEAEETKNGPAWARASGELRLATKTMRLLGALPEKPKDGAPDHGDGRKVARRVYENAAEIVALAARLKALEEQVAKQKLKVFGRGL